MRTVLPLSFKCRQEASRRVRAHCLCTLLDFVFLGCGWCFGVFVSFLAFTLASAFQDLCMAAQAQSAPKIA